MWGLNPVVLFKSKHFFVSISSPYICIILFETLNRVNSVLHLSQNFPNPNPGGGSDPSNKSNFHPYSFSYSLGPCVGGPKRHHLVNPKDKVMYLEMPYVFYLNDFVNNLYISCLEKNVYWRYSSL